MIDEKFIAIATPRFIKTLRPFINIERSKDIEYIKKSGKSFIAWHPTANACRPVWEYFRKHGLPSYFVERGALPNTVVIDPDGFLSDSSSYDTENWDYPLNSGQRREIDAYIDELVKSASSLEYQRSGRINEKKFRSSLNIPWWKGFVFVPLQLENDTVIKKWSGWVDGVEEFYNQIQKLSRHFKDTIFLVKPHPLSKIKIKETENLINVNQFHYKDCLMVSNKVVTINSGVGLQALAWNKPTITIGKAFYQFDGLNYNAKDFDELCDLILVGLDVDTTRAKRFLYFLKFVLYSDCIQIKRKESRFINRTDEVRYTNVRIFKK